jgi:hypothetical protein
MIRLTFFVRVFYFHLQELIDTLRNMSNQAGGNDSVLGEDLGEDIFQDEDLLGGRDESSEEEVDEESYYSEEEYDEEVVEEDGSYDDDVDGDYDSSEYDEETVL